ncbi:MAG: choice-of-anchor J domain-containing protein [Bacteroidota bacterium]|nr:choice-of-anchor J domain-containing protein [Bacteroidota bacterium]
MIRRVTLLFILMLSITPAGLLFTTEKSKNKSFPIKEIFNNRSQSVIYSPFKTFYFSQITPASTVVFEESFEGTSGFPPLGWKTVNKDGGGTTGPWFQGNPSIFTAYSGNGYAAANYQGANDFYIDEWLISPLIPAISSNDTLTFYHRSPDYSSWADSVEVRISTTDTAIASFTKSLDYFETSTTGWTQKKYALKNFVTNGSNIYIAFRYLMYDGGISGFNSDYVGIDLVQIVRPQLQKDMKVVSIDFPIHGTKLTQGSTFNPTATFENVGSSVLSNIPVRMRIFSPTGEMFESNKTVSSLNTNQSTSVTFDSYTPLINGAYKVRVYSLLTGDENSANDSLGINFNAAILLAGTFTVGAGGDIPTINAAVDSLSKNIISGDITLSLISSVYNESPVAIPDLDYSLSTNKVIIKPASGKSPKININSTADKPYGFKISGATKIIIDGSNSSLEEKNLTINLLGNNGKIGIRVVSVFGASADSNIIKNLCISTGADSLLSTDGYFGILITGYNSSFPAVGNTISNCDITKHGSIGIAAQWLSGVVIENNYIHDWKQVGGTNDVHGIWIADGVSGAIVRANIISNILTVVNFSWAVGIENSSGSTSNSKFYNNFIHNVLSYGSGTQVNYSRGIYSSNTANMGDGYYYNSIYLSGIDFSTSPLSRTTGFEFYGGVNISLKNNIVFNETNLTGTSTDNKAYAIYLSPIPTNFVSNNNDLYTPSAKGVVGFNISNRVTLNDWKNSFAPKQDSLSISADPIFVSKATGNLHIVTSVSSPVNSAGLPIPGITTDIDGNTRSTSTPDIGADEFSPGVFSVVVDYTSGWNLVSVPVTVSDYTKTKIFPTSISNTFSYDGAYDAQATLKNGTGYWLKFGAYQYINIDGLPRLIDTVDVKAGWNLVGSVSFSIPTSSIIQLPDNNIISSIYGYNLGYMPVTVLVPGKGYWIKIKQDGKLVLITP